MVTHQCKPDELAMLHDRFSRLAGAVGLPLFYFDVGISAEAVYLQAVFSFKEAGAYESSAPIHSRKFFPKSSDSDLDILRTLHRLAGDCLREYRTDRFTYRGDPIFRRDFS